MKLSPHFTLEEFTVSATAARFGIDNTLPTELLTEMQNTADMLERIRAYLAERARRVVPIYITSGYRCPLLNAAIGSKPGSDHIKAMAVDFKAPEFGTPFEICKALAPAVPALEIGQLIHEHQWVHVSTHYPDKYINRILTVQGTGYTPGIMEA